MFIQNLDRDCHMKKLCKNCNNETENPSFCSKSCAATFNNRKFPKRKLFKIKCVKCHTELNRTSYKDRRRTLCESCNPMIVDWESITYGEVRERRSFQKNSRIRELSRNKFLKHNPNPSCHNCGYSKHVEVCHIKGISTFSTDTKISEINDLKNLVGLCPNCHWEFDQGFLHLEFPEFDNLH